MNSDSATPAELTALNYQDMVNLQHVDPSIALDLRYGTTNNFTGKVLYQHPICFLRQSTALKLIRVQQALLKQELSLKIYDGYRPVSVQWELWKAFPNANYVADPRVGSRHNRGVAVDLTLVNLQGTELEMPTDFDDFSHRAHRDCEDLNANQIRNRQRLEEAMTLEGFIPHPHEWWHFDDVDWKRYDLLDVELLQLESLLAARPTENRCADR